MIRSRFLPLATAAVITGGLIAAGTPAVAADTVTPRIPCLNVLGIVATCPAVPAPVPPAPADPPSAAKTTTVNGCKDATVHPIATNLVQVDQATLCLINKERTRRRLRALRSQPALGKLATSYAGQLVTDQFFDHTTPGGVTVLDRIRATGYLAGRLSTWRVGENIAYGTGSLSTPQSIVRGWMASPGHRANILRPQFREIGVGVALGSPNGPAGATYVHDFGLREHG